MMELILEVLAAQMQYPQLQHATIPKLEKLYLRWLVCEMHESNDFLFWHKTYLRYVDFDDLFLWGSWDAIRQTLDSIPTQPEIHLVGCKLAGDAITEAYY
jgi:hypothetical protein